MATNDFKPFATGTNANVTTQADWETLPALATGFQSGKASSAQINKALRQGTLMASVIGSFIQNAGLDALDDGDAAALVASLTSAMNSNLGLGDIVLAGTASGLLSAAGFIELPLIIGGMKQSFFIQWSGTLSFQTATPTVMATRTWTFPTAFPNTCLGVYTSMCNALTYNPSSSPTTSSGNITTTSADIACGYYASTASAIAIAIGY